MKNLTIPALLLPLLLSACSNHEPMPAQRPTAVSFKTHVAAQGRGAAAAQDGNGRLQQNFGVFVYSNAEGKADASTPPSSLYNEPVTYTPGTGFAYTNTIYWPSSGKLGFYAYSPFHTDGGATGIANFVPADRNTPGVAGFTFSVAPAVANQVDLLTARAEALSGGTVALAFTHALTKVEVQARTSAGNYRVAIIGATLTGIQSVGDFRFAEGSSRWSAQQTPADYDASILTTGNSKPDGTGQPAAVVLYSANTTDFTEVTNPANALYLLPQTLAADARLVITYNIFNAANGNRITPLDAQQVTLDIGRPEATQDNLTEWKKSHRVVYRLTFAAPTTGAGSAVTFEPTVSDWSTEWGTLN